MSDPIVCDRCAGTMVYEGRISLPPQTIYRCGACGRDRWVAEAAPPYQPRMNKAVDQLPAQQQQQPQPKSESQSDADENADAQRLQSGFRSGGGEDK